MVEVGTRAGTGGTARKSRSFPLKLSLMAFPPKKNFQEKSQEEAFH